MQQRKREPKFDSPETLAALEQVVQQLDIDLRYEKGDFDGGLCRVGEKTMLIVNIALDTGRRIQLIARELAQLRLEDIYIVPATRDLIERFANQQNKVEV